MFSGSLGYLQVGGNVDSIGLGKAERKKAVQKIAMSSSMRILGYLMSNNHEQLRGSALGRACSFPGRPASCRHMPHSEQRAHHSFTQRCPHTSGVPSHAAISKHMPGQCSVASPHGPKTRDRGNQKLLGPPGHRYQAHVRQSQNEKNLLSAGSSTPDLY